ncbi:hypothetical protein WKW80_05240 [Variovorax humicola]|uniref:Uncharacterized protein n=1 Tax=Variovorax humicola TaxID=1769758 RepID=A0ABU8VUM1_9BURK
MSPHPALAALRDDVRTLSPTAARYACIYLAALQLPDTWATALLRDLHARAGDTPWPEFEALVAHLGVPCAWSHAACLGDAFDMRCWLAAVDALAAAHAPLPPLQP